MSGPARLRLHLTPAAESAVRRGHPWVYADRIARQNRPGQPGDLAAVYDRRDRFLALGLFDPASPLRVRILHVGPPVTVDAAWWNRRWTDALNRRTGLLGPDTTGWRCVHGENDGWPGCVLDRYGDVLVLKLYTAAWIPWLPTLVPTLLAAAPARSLVVRLGRNVLAGLGPETAIRDGTVLAGEPVGGRVEFLESGLHFEADVIRGQKTGFFLDQRENRRLVETLAARAAVLNAFSFSGGFSLYAARGGARSVTDLDISPHALESAKRHFAMNAGIPAVARALHETVRADTFDWLAADTRRRFDLVILDPPSLAKRESEKAGALAAYTRLARLGADRVLPRGLLLCASCSAHVGADEFFDAVRRGLRGSGRRFEEWRTTAHPPDHPARFPEAHYLKAIYLRLD